MEDFVEKTVYQTKKFKISLITDEGSKVLRFSGIDGTILFEPTQEQIKELIKALNNLELISN